MPLLDLPKPKRILDKDGNPITPPPKQRLGDGFTDLELQQPMELTPDPKCKDCHGTGAIGRDVKTKEPILCRCLMRSMSAMEQIKVNAAIKRRQEAEAEKKKITSGPKGSTD